MKNNISFLHSYDSLEIALQEISYISKKQIKKNISHKKRKQKVRSKESFFIPLNTLNFLRISPDYEGPVINFIDRDSKDFLAINKPPQVHCHPLGYEDKCNCLSFFRDYGLNKELEVNSKNYDRGLLFRLDYETSGLVLYCKNEDLYYNLRKNFSKFFKKKIYLAIVQGDYDIKKFKVKGFLTPHGEKGHIMKVSDSPVNKFSKEGSLEVSKVFYSDEKNLSLLKISLKEGIRHQIRALMQKEGFPLLGDALYGGKKASRLFLHSFKYEIELNHKKYSWSSNYIEDFLKVLGRSTQIDIRKTIIEGV